MSVRVGKSQIRSHAFRSSLIELLNVQIIVGESSLATPCRRPARALRAA
jgi:hypothetical protein